LRIYLLFLSGDGEMVGEIVFSIATLLKMEAITMASASSPKEERSFLTPPI
jgi:hypothetical protein